MPHQEADNKHQIKQKENEEEVSGNRRKDDTSLCFSLSLSVSLSPSPNSPPRIVASCGLHGATAILWDVEVANKDVLYVLS